MCGRCEGARAISEAARELTRACIIDVAARRGLIDVKLHEVYDPVLQEELPPDMVQLLAQLK